VTSGISIDERLRPFRKEGLLRRTAPFLVAMVLAYAAIRLPAAQRDKGAIFTAAALNLALVLAVVVLPWHKLPRFAEVLPPLMYMVCVALLRDAMGGSNSAYETLLVLPVFWLALYGTRSQLFVGLIGVFVLLAMPVLSIGEPQYPDEEWRRVLLWTIVAGIVGLAVQDLVEMVRQRADALHTVSEAVGRRTREIETRSAICEAAMESAGGDFAFMLEPDANDRRLVTTAATNRAAEGSEAYLSESHSAVIKTYASGREHLQHEFADGDSPVMSESGIATPVESVLWFPIPGRDAPMGVLAVAWTHRAKRLPETLPAVMEALAAEAAGVIERTTLILKLESQVDKDDPVTGLPNERAWEEEVPRELSRARRQGTALSVVIVNLGDFEPAPDGDLGSDDKRFLKSAADRFRKLVGPSDFLAHRSAGRFAALFPNVGSEEAEEKATEFRMAAPEGRDCTVAVATWNGVELPAALVARAENQAELERAASRRD
jgi:GGDEF domain-containing protein